MGKNQRTTFAKLQRERARQAKQAEKRERRRARRAGEEPIEGPELDVAGPAADAPSTDATALGGSEGNPAPEV
jgi:hypothetical protein